MEYICFYKAPSTVSPEIPPCRQETAGSRSQNFMVVLKYSCIPRNLLMLIKRCFLQYVILIKFDNGETSRDRVSDDVSRDADSIQEPVVIGYIIEKKTNVV